MEQRKIKLTDLAKGLDPEALKLENPIVVPDSQFRELLDKVIERGNLEDISERTSFYVDESPTNPVTWMKIARLPVSPDNAEDYDLFSRWQGVLSSLHEWGYRVYFLLQREKGQTGLYIGVRSLQSFYSSKDAIEQVMEATSGSMPGIELHKMDDAQVLTDITMNMMKYKSIGAVTGLPSFFDEGKPGVLQTLDSLAFGIRGIQNDERNYSMLVIADPINDQGITDIMDRMRTLGSEIHTFVERTVNESRSEGENAQKGLNQYAASGLGGVAGQLLAKIGGIFVPGLAEAESIGSLICSALGMGAGAMMGNLNRTITQNVSLSVNAAYLDKFAQYAEQLMDIHVERMKQGRNLGYWNVATYVLGTDRKDVTTVNGMLRSVYAGKESYVEPIRLHVLKEDSGAMEIVRDRLNIIPIFDNTQPDMTEATEWHIFGRNYQYLSTPMNTKEFALATSLPRQDVPGLRFVKTAVRFSNNPPIVSGDAMNLGNVVNMGVEQNTRYGIDHDDLVRHTLVVGSTGSGKSCTCKRMVAELMERDVPVLIIEPAKDDYVRWAIKMNETLPEEKKFRIYMPGTDNFEGTPLDTLKLCPFEPAAIPGAPIDMTARCENLISLISASLPADDILPVLIDEIIYKMYDISYPGAFESGMPMPQQEKYPLLGGLKILSEIVMKDKKYEEKVRANLTTCLQTRFQYLTRGTRGKLLNVMRSTPYAELFDRPTVINISGISAARDKALIMSVLMLSLYEYKKSRFTYDPVYRAEAQKNRLMHLTLVEEAHNFLTKPEGTSANNPQKVVADLFTNILSEIRSYGEGVMIVDQYPTRLIPDAIKNTNYKVIHRLVSPDDCGVMGSSISLRPEQEALIPCLTPGNAIVCGDRDDAAAWIHVKRTTF